MRNLRRPASTAWRLLKGAARGIPLRAHWGSRLEAIESADVVSFDIFDTLLVKAPDLDRDVFAALSRRIAGSLEPPGSDGANGEAAVRDGLNWLHGELMNEAVASGMDPAISRRSLYQAFLGALKTTRRSSLTVDELLELERTLVHELTALNPEVLELIRTCKVRCKRIIAVTDTNHEAGEIAELLRRHGFEGFDAIYASCDVGRSKFRGGLFEHVLAQERVPPDRLVHVGDDRFSDIYSARSHGIRALRYRLRGAGHSFNAPGFRVGFESLGPIFAGFCHLLLLESKRAGFSRLAFVSRDGDFLREASARLSAAIPFLAPPRMDDVYLSRRATALPARSRLDRSALEEVRGVRAEGPIHDLFFEYFGLDRTAFTSASSCDADSLEALLEDPEFQSFVKEQRERQTELLGDYLRGEGLYGARDTALVDVGWRGSTQRALNETFGADPKFTPLQFVYLALWSESGPILAPGGFALGILSDQRRSGRLLESAAWQLAFLFEAVCRASHGTVTGFTRDDSGAVRPRLAEDTPGRRAEICAEASREPIRKGILAYLDHYGRGLKSPLADEIGLRRASQWRMLRLAFFPRAWELAAVSALVQTEGHAETWSVPLVSAQRVHPLRSPRRWINGLTSPWRAGYVAATGGYPFALAFLLMEWLLLAAPRSLRRRLRGWALKQSVSPAGSAGQEAP